MASSARTSLIYSQPNFHKQVNQSKIQNKKVSSCRIFGNIFAWDPNLLVLIHLILILAQASKQIFSFSFSMIIVKGWLVWFAFAITFAGISLAQDLQFECILCAGMY